MYHITIRSSKTFLFVVALLVIIALTMQGQVRVVSLSPTMTEIIYALNAQNQLYGVTKYCDSPPQLLKDKKANKYTIVGDFVKMDLDLVESLKPDLVLTDTYFQRKHAEELRKRGIKVLHYEPKSLKEVFASIEEIGAAIGKGKLAKDLTAGYWKEIAQIREQTSKLPRLKVYMEINHMGPWTIGNQSPLNDLIDIAGGVNIYADSSHGVLVVPNEDIVKKNPDVILSPLWIDAEWDGITTLGEIYARPGYATTTAYKYSRIIYYDSALLKHEGPRQVLGIRKLAFLLHPNEFECPNGTIPWELGKIK
jgi:iron complex transport system substrate-binding protein